MCIKNFKYIKYIKNIKFISRTDIKNNKLKCITNHCTNSNLMKNNKLKLKQKRLRKGLSKNIPKSISKRQYSQILGKNNKLPNIFFLNKIYIAYFYLQYVNKQQKQ